MPQNSKKPILLTVEEPQNFSQTEKLKVVMANLYLKFELFKRNPEHKLLNLRFIFTTDFADAEIANFHF